MAVEKQPAPEKQAAPEKEPDWLATLIREFETLRVGEPPPYIARYVYRGEITYFEPARCCDIPSTLYHADGTILCHPDGGITGGGDGRCPTFFSDRRDEAIIWLDPQLGR